MLAVSCISTMNVDWPRAMLSDAPTRAKMRSTTGSFAVARRHERPGLRQQAHAARSAAGRWTCRPCSGRSGSPAGASCRSSVMSFGTNAPPARAARRPDGARRRRASRRRRARAAWCSCRPSRFRRAPPARRARRCARAVSCTRGASAATCARSRSKIASSRSTIRSSAPSTFSSCSFSAGVMNRSPPAIVCLRM